MCHLNEVFNEEKGYNNKNGRRRFKQEFKTYFLRL